MHRIHFESIDSTNTQARALAAVHAGKPLLVTADEQSAGRGRRGRRWQSPRGGAWMSMAWPWRKEPHAARGVALAAAVAVRQALGDVAGSSDDDFQIKWPNDILIRDRKVAGILCEQFLDGTGAGVLILGIGVNVDFDLTLFRRGEAEKELRHPATTLAAALGRPVGVEDVVAAVSTRLVQALDEFERDGLSPSLLAELRNRLAYVGEVRSWEAPSGTITGRVLGVDDAGRLLLRAAGGEFACEWGEFSAQ